MKKLNKKINPDRAIKVGAKKVHVARKFMYNQVERTHQKYMGILHYFEMLKKFLILQNRH